MSEVTFDDQNLKSEGVRRTLKYEEEKASSGFSGWLVARGIAPNRRMAEIQYNSIPANITKRFIFKHRNSNENNYNQYLFLCRIIIVFIFIIDAGLLFW